MWKHTKERTCGKNEQCTAYRKAYRKLYNTQHVLRLIEEWKRNLTVAVLMDLSKAVDFIPYDLVITKFPADGFRKNCCISSHLNTRKQYVSKNNIKSNFESRNPQRSIVNPILFNIFFNNFLSFTLAAMAHNFADDKTLLSIC